MATEFKLEDVEKALLDRFLEKVGEGVQIASLSSADLNEDGLVVQRKAVLLYLVRENLAPGRDQLRLLYEAQQDWIALCGVRNLTGVAAERREVLELVSKVKAAVAGKRITLADGQTSAPMELTGVQLEQVAPEGTVYSVAFRVSDTSQFLPE